MVSSISAYDKSIAMSYYSYGRQGQNLDTPVGSVTPVKAIKKLDDGSDRIKTIAKTNEEKQTEKLKMTKQDEEVMDTYEDASVAKYGDLSNPYEAMKMASESIVLTGMNFNALA